MLRRRTFLHEIAGVGALTLLSACVPASPRVPRIGYVTVVSTADYDPQFQAFTEEFAQLGYNNGRTINIEFRSAGGHVDQLDAIIGDLLQLPIDVLVPVASPAAIAAKRVANATPVVFVEVNDPVGQGLVPNLARPGGTMTGVSTLSGALSSKRVELLKEALPAAQRVAVLWNAANSGMALALSQTHEAAEALQLTVLEHGVRTNEDVPGALENVSREQPDALIVLPAIGTSSPTLIQEFVASHQLPTMFSDRGPVDLGGLMGLGPNYSDLNRRAAQLAIRVLRGAKPGDLPVEQPSLFDFVVNMSAAHALGISIPESVLLQATDILR